MEAQWGGAGGPGQFEGLEELQGEFGVVEESCSEWAWRGEKSASHIPPWENTQVQSFSSSKALKKDLSFKEE